MQLQACQQASIQDTPLLEIDIVAEWHALLISSVLYSGWPGGWTVKKLGIICRQRQESYLLSRLPKEFTSPFHLNFVSRLRRRGVYLYCCKCLHGILLN